MLPGALQCKLAEESPFGSGKVTPGPGVSTGTIRPPNVPSASNVTIGHQTSGGNKGVASQTPPPLTAKPPSMPSQELNSVPKNFPKAEPENGFKENALRGVGTVARWAGTPFGRGQQWEQGVVDPLAQRFSGTDPKSFQMAQQFATGQYGQSGADRLTQLQWAGQDLQPLQGLAGDKDGRTGLGRNLGLWSENGVDMGNQDFRGKVLQESLKAQQNPDQYAAQTQGNGRAWNFLKDNWKPIAGVGAGLVGLGMLNRSQNQQTPQQMVTPTGTYQPPADPGMNPYQPFAYRTDSE